MMKTKNLVINGLAVLFLATASSVMACGGEASGKHFGTVTGVDTNKSTFTIRDAETRSPITFQAKSTVLDKAQSASGSIVVNYEENDKGQLEAMSISL